MKSYKNVITLIFVMILSTMIMVGCVKKIDEVPSDTSTEQPEPKPTEDLEDKEDENNNLRDLGIKYEGKEIAIMDLLDDEDIESILGKAEDIKSHTYSKYDGLNMDPLEGFTEKQYYYPGMVIKTIDATHDKQFFVFSIDITSDKYKTTRNITIGDSFEKLKEFYPEGKLLSGEELTGAEDDYRYEPIDYSSSMTFHIKDKKVESILMSQLLD